MERRKEGKKLSNDKLMHKRIIVRESQVPSHCPIHVCQIHATNMTNKSE